MILNVEPAPSPGLDAPHNYLLLRFEAATQRDHAILDEV
jgi:hypothetical protein